MFFQQSENCHICMSEIKLPKGGSLPPMCPVCGADLVNLGAEVVQDVIFCEHIKGSLGIGAGQLIVTDKRLLWITRAAQDNGNILVQAITGRNAGKVPVNVLLGDVVRIDDCKKLLRIGITIHTKSGEAFNFFLVNRGNPQILKDFLTPYVGNVFS